MKRWFLIRHVRWFILSRKLRVWETFWERHGYALNTKDVEHLRRVWKGEA